MNRGEKRGVSREVSKVRKEGQVGGVQVGIKANREILLSCLSSIKAFSADSH